MQARLNATSNEFSSKEWRVRKQALIDLRAIVFGGVFSSKLRDVFIDWLANRINHALLNELLTAAQTQLALEACSLVAAISLELGNIEDRQLSQRCSPLFESILRSVVVLCKKTREVAEQGIACLHNVALLCGKPGLPRVVRQLCDAALANKLQPNIIRGVLNALTGAFRVWDPRCFLKRDVALVMRVVEMAMSHSKEPVRSDGAELYCALKKVKFMCAQMKKVVVPIQTKKILDKKWGLIDAQWEKPDETGQNVNELQPPQNDGTPSATESSLPKCQSARDSVRTSSTAASSGLDSTDEETSNAAPPLSGTHPPLRPRPPNSLVVPPKFSTQSPASAASCTSDATSVATLRLHVANLAKNGVEYHRRLQTLEEDNEQHGEDIQDLEHRTARTEEELGTAKQNWTPKMVCIVESLFSSAGILIAHLFSYDVPRIRHCMLE